MLKSEDRLTALETRLALLDEKIAIIEAAPTLKLYLRDRGMRARVNELLNTLAKLETGNLEFRSSFIRDTDSRDLRTLVETAPIESIIKIARDLPSELKQKWLDPIRDPARRKTIAAALHPVEQLPEVVRIRSFSGEKIHVVHRDESGQVLFAVNVERGSFIELEKAEWESRVAASDELREHLAAKHLDVVSLNEVETRNWFAGACNEEQFTVSAEFTIERVGESEPEPVATAPVPATKMVNPHDELRQYHGRLAHEARTKRVQEMAEAFKAAFPDQGDGIAGH